MNDTTSIQPARGVSPAVPESKREKRLPWGRWSIRAVAITYLTVLLIIPLVIIFRDGLREGLGVLWRQVTRPVAWNALKLTLWTAGIMTVINTVMGAITSYRDCRAARG